MPGASSPAYQFGAYRLDVAEQRLLHDGRVLPITPKVFDVLRILVENHGHLVEREKLVADVWNDSFVEEGALSRSISILRKTLGENGAVQQYIETVPKRGYRFVAPVTEWVPAADPPAADSSSATPALTRRGLPWKAALAAAVLIVAAIFFAIVGGSKSDAHRLTRSAPVHRQVTFTGKEGAPTLSPDGKRIAYVSFEKPEKRLIVQELSGGAPLTIFTAPEINYLRWSPDGTELLMWTRGGGKNGVYVIPQLGGTPRPIAIGEGISCWSPDGSTIAATGYRGKIHFVDAHGKGHRAVTLRDPHWSNIWDLDWSATGTLSFVGSDPQGRYALWTMRADGSEQRVLLTSDSEIPTARWAPGNEAIYYFRRLDQTFSLFKVSVAPGRDAQDVSPATVIAGLETDHSFALSADGKRLVYARAPYFSNLWLVEANDGRELKTRELTHGTFLVERPAVSPDGKSIAFNVGHEPATRLHVMPIDGGPSKPLTQFNAFSLGAVWSPDGRQIAFASRAGGVPRVWTVDVDGSNPRALSWTNMSDFFDLAWAPGSRILYQQSGNTNYYQLDAGTRSETLLLSDSSKGWLFSPAYAPDGFRIAVSWSGHPPRGIWLIDTRDRRETPLYPSSSSSVSPIAWSADARFVYAIEGKNLNLRGLEPPHGETLTEAKIVRIRVDGNEVKTVSLPFEEIGGVSMTPDGRRFVVAVYTSRSDVWVVDNFDPSP
jgi:Tol biopolymer transport system component/DNA-binding winged helix-turn-helix (wHTH) protein